MIQSFKDRETARVFSGRHSRRLPTDVQRTALRKLQQIEAARNLNDLRVPPGNRCSRTSLLRGEEVSVRVDPHRWSA